MAMNHQNERPSGQMTIEEKKGIGRKLANYEAYAIYSTQSIALKYLLAETYPVICQQRNNITSYSQEFWFQMRNEQMIVQSRLVFAQASNNFLTYLSRLLLRILIINPPIFGLATNWLAKNRGGRVIPSEDPIESLSDKRLVPFERLSFYDTKRFFKNVLDYDIHADATEESEVAQIVALRNLFVHNNGLADANYVKNYPGENLHVGANALNNQTLLWKSLGTFDPLVLRLHQDAQSRWNLELLDPMKVNLMLPFELEKYNAWLTTVLKFLEDPRKRHMTNEEVAKYFAIIRDIERKAQS